MNYRDSSHFKKLCGILMKRKATQQRIRIKKLCINEKKGIRYFLCFRKDEWGEVSHKKASK